jgi:amidase
VTTWITRFVPPGADPAGRLRVAVKDAIDVSGAITTAGCAAVRDHAEPAEADAACLAGARAAGAVLVGKTTLTELCVSPLGLNPEFGTPVNPLAPDRIPGGSSSGSAVAVATGEADVALGTDTGGSVRIPAACCGIVGLKPTWGRIPTAGVWPLAPSLDTVGVLARDMAGTEAGMRLIDRGWGAARQPARTVARLRIDGVDRATDDAIEAALATAGLQVRAEQQPDWNSFYPIFDTIFVAELWAAHHALVDARGVGDFVRGGIRAGRDVGTDQLAAARSARVVWRRRMTDLFTGAELVALPTLVGPPPLLQRTEGYLITRLTAPMNLAGLPALAVPVPSGGPVPASLQLVGPPYREDLLCATGTAIERALVR